MADMGNQRKEEAPGAVTMKIGNLAFDPALLKLRCGEATADLTACESRIVACLMRNAGRPASASELRLRALGIRAVHPTTDIAKHIHNIRRKIAAIDATATIKTTRGEGYAISPLVSLNAFANSGAIEITPTCSFRQTRSCRAAAHRMSQKPAP